MSSRNWHWRTRVADRPNNTYNIRVDAGHASSWRSDSQRTVPLQYLSGELSGYPSTSGMCFLSASRKMSVSVSREGGDGWPELVVDARNTHGSPALRTSQVKMLQVAPNYWRWAYGVWSSLLLIYIAYLSTREYGTECVVRFCDCWFYPAPHTSTYKGHHLQLQCLPTHAGLGPNSYLSPPPIISTFICRGLRSAPSSVFYVRM